MTRPEYLIIIILSLFIAATSSFALEKGNIPNSVINRDDVAILFIVDNHPLDAKSEKDRRFKISSMAYAKRNKSPLRLLTNVDIPPVVNETVQIGQAFITSFLLHELGHKVVADYVGATGTKFSFLTNRNGEFFLGQSTFEEIADESRLPFSMAGEVAADLTFEHALQSYRKNPSLYNKSLLLFSGTDFLWYCFYSFYLSDGHPYYDPVAISKETGMSKDAIFSIALAKTMINAYRVYSGKDYVIPYFAVDRDSAMLNLAINF